MFNSSAVLIPVYKLFDRLNNFEIKSLIQCSNIFYNKTIILIGPYDLNFEKYQLFFKDKVFLCKVERFPSHYFANVQGYNKLLISYKFYYRFKIYNYILVYQLDSFIFKDDLYSWCLKGYDYVGAPWFDANEIKSHQMYGVGNGGFSLRKISTFIKITSRLEKLQLLHKCYIKLHFNKILKYSLFLRLIFIPLFWKFNVNKYLMRIIQGRITNEDEFFCIWVKLVYPQFNIAPPNEAIKFSFECYPSHLFKLNNNQLPMGCHAWERYELDFWKSHIDC